MKQEPIQVQIVFDLNGHLASAYNRGMERATTEWVLFIDHDLFLCNKYWYRLSINAIEQLKDLPVGWISAVTNRIGNPAQKAEGAPANHNLVDHIAFAKRLYQEYGSKVERCRGAMSGFWILTNKTAWKACGGFNEERKRLLGVDNAYSRALNRAGFAHYRMPGLYVYHIYRDKKIFMRW